MKIRALSIAAPNGNRIAQGFKTIEVRSWRPDLEPSEDFLIVENSHHLKEEWDVDPEGRAVALAKVKTVREYQLEDMTSACATMWSDGYYSWLLYDVRPISYNHAVPAALGLYPVELSQKDIHYLTVTPAAFSEEFYRARFLELLKRNELVWEILRRSSALGISNWACGAGFIQQGVFNLFHGRPVLEGIKDVDWVYFDASDLSEEAEKAVVEKIRAAMSDIPLPFDVKNQARVHLWYERKFGYSIAPYKSLEDAIATWPTTSTAIALSNAPENAAIIAPFGFADLMEMKIRPNKRQITEEIYLAKVNRWKANWPRIQVVNWSEA